MNNSFLRLERNTALFKYPPFYFDVRYYIPSDPYKLLKNYQFINKHSVVSIFFSYIFKFNIQKK